jgi:antitoxin VapB
MESRRVRIFRNGRNQAVRIPREFEFAGEEAVMTRDGDRLILEPPPKMGLAAYLAHLTPLDEEFPPFEDMPAEPVDI